MLEIECVPNHLLETTHPPPEPLISHPIFCGHPAVISSICRIPCEVLCRIFLFTLPAAQEFREYEQQLEAERSNRIREGDGGKSELQSSAHRVVSPWILGHVCRHWRNVALSFSRLWSTLVVPYLCTPDPNIDAWPRRTVLGPMFITHLERSANTFLDIVIDPGHYPFSPLGFPDDLLVQSSPRWKSLDCHLQSILPHVSHNLPFLECLTLHGFMSWDDDTQINAPNLREVAISGTLPPFLPWFQITKFR
ncbi:hypothetical protein B0H16DRAFT_669647, partial [Mycena metata]